MTTGAGNVRSPCRSAAHPDYARSCCVQEYAKLQRNTACPDRPLVEDMQACCAECHACDGLQTGTDAHLVSAVQNPEYIQWVREEVQALPYEIERNAFNFRWDHVTASSLAGIALSASDLVVMTQTSPDRCASCPHEYNTQVIVN